jgi:hypothetical protein
MELLVNVDDDRNVTAIFRVESLPIQKIVEFKSASCKLVEKYPENWDYKRLESPDNVQGLKRVSAEFAVYVPGAVLVPVTFLSGFRPTESLETYNLPRTNPSQNFHRERNLQTRILRRTRRYQRTKSLLRHRLF